ncbi:AGE family epimerase/isomerase [Phenylobacterium sp.]|uniref:AGE family epimerase/isomerase n=1 Tax=Phenylobacterium sp. TaxID=1871053 RepID=UPI00286BFBE4|nr:AGE family epimerase/isomerase [Phenylobacterium sp.]
MVPPFTTLPDAAAWYGAWLREAALPLWADAGVDPLRGVFQEALSVEGRARPAPRRARAQARQVFVFASAVSAGYGDQYLLIARRGFQGLLRDYRRPDGLFINSVAIDGAPLDTRVDIYEQAFALLAMAALQVADPMAGDLAGDAARTLAALDDRRAPRGGYRESGAQPYQANCHMHLFESALAWEATGAAGWAGLSDELAGLALRHFIDSETGALREFFDADWRPLSGEGGLVEPGHQFEWAWLLERWGRARGVEAARAAARRLYRNGLRGVDAGRGVAVNALWEDFAIRDGDARLWPQTERLKAALILGEADDALSAAQGLARYLDTPARGAWRDTLKTDGTFVAGPAPATSFYHLIVAILELTDQRAAPAGGVTA